MNMIINIMKHIAQPIQSGQRTQIQDHVIILHNLNPTKRTVRSVPNSPVNLIFTLSTFDILYDYINDIEYSNRN